MDFMIQLCSFIDDNDKNRKSDLDLNLDAQ